MDLVVSTLAERPDAEPQLWQLSNEWPELMKHDPVADLYNNDVERAIPEHVLLGWYDDLVARAVAGWTGDAPPTR